ncbi:Glycine cleavage system H protein 3 [Forsythia ovata]|uniref:Glycine cleavage system H protein 3 n=1 Tax=Forsythia ovata TaxID=205694 RepID=A0ABD1WEV8_9LAMI
MALRMWASSAANALRVSTATASRPASSLFRSFSAGPSGRSSICGASDVGKTAKQGDGFGAVESVKATSDVNSPISGEIVEVNSKLNDTPGLINSSPYGEGWMIKVKPSNPSELDSLMGAKEYTKFCEEEDASH